MSFSDPLGLKCKPLFDNNGNPIGQQCDGVSPGNPYPSTYSPTGDNSAFPAANNDTSLLPCIRACLPTEEIDVPSYIGYTCIGFDGAAIALTKFDRFGPVVERSYNILAPYIHCKKKCEEEKKCPSN